MCARACAPARTSRRRGLIVRVCVCVCAHADELSLLRARLAEVRAGWRIALRVERCTRAPCSLCSALCCRIEQKQALVATLQLELSGKSEAVETLAAQLRATSDRMNDSVADVQQRDELVSGLVRCPARLCTRTAAERVSACVLQKQRISETEAHLDHARAEVEGTQPVSASALSHLLPWRRSRASAHARRVR